MISAPVLSPKTTGENQEEEGGNGTASVYPFKAQTVLAVFSGLNVFHVGNGFTIPASQSDELPCLESTPVLDEQGNSRQ